MNQHLGLLIAQSDSEYAWRLKLSTKLELSITNEVGASPASAAGLPPRNGMGRTGFEPALSAMPYQIEIGGLAPELT